MKLLLSINLIFILVFSILAILYLKEYSPPNTYINNQNLSGKSLKQIKGFINNLNNTSLNIQVNDRVYVYYPSNIGVFIDERELIDRIFYINKKKYPINLFLLIKSWITKNEISTPLIFTSDFYKFTNETKFEFSQKEDEVIVDDITKLLVYKDNEEKYRIDPINFKDLLIYSFAKGQIIKPKVSRIYDQEKNLVNDYNSNLTNVFGKDVNIFVKNGESLTSLTIPKNLLKDLIKVNYNQGKVDFEVENNEFDNFFTINLGHFRGEDKDISLSSLKEDLIKLVDSRFNKIESDSLLAKVEYASNTQGDKADKYIEIDISQQKMYLFENSSLRSVHRISSGLYYPTPVGEFKILNKAINAYSKIFNVWMPYWMAFYYGPDLNAYFGIHELPYYYTGDGTKITRPRDFLGSPHTGDCVSLDIGEAKEVYDFSFVNMPVYIFN